MQLAAQSDTITSLSHKELSRSLLAVKDCSSVHSSSVVKPTVRADYIWPSTLMRCYVGALAVTFSVSSKVLCPWPGSLPWLLLPHPQSTGWLAWVWRYETYNSQQEGMTVGELPWCSAFLVVFRANIVSVQNRQQWVLDAVREFWLVQKIFMWQDNFCEKPDVKHWLVFSFLLSQTFFSCWWVTSVCAYLWGFCAYIGIYLCSQNPIPLSPLTLLAMKKNRYAVSLSPMVRLKFHILPSDFLGIPENRMGTRIFMTLVKTSSQNAILPCSIERKGSQI